MEKDNYIIRFTKTALNDLNEISYHIISTQLDGNVVIDLVEKFINKTDSLIELPFRNPLLLDSNLSELGIRKFIVGKYIFLYKIDSNDLQIYIIRILVSKMSWKEMLG